MPDTQLILEILSLGTMGMREAIQWAREEEYERQYDDDRWGGWCDDHNDPRNLFEEWED